MEFNHDKEGVHVKYKNNTILLNGAAVTKELRNDEDLIKFSKSILTLIQSLGRVSSKELNPDDLQISEYKSLEDIHHPVPLYKYISIQDYENYFSKGHFQLGSSKYYRDIEKNEARDGFEGYNISILQVNNSHIPVTLFRCNNYLIFCGTSVKSTGYMRGKFGQVEMEISDTVLFATNLAQSIGALDYTIGQVEYSNSKISKSEHIYIPPFEPQDFIHREDIIELLIKTSLYPSLFVKPEMFKEENELSIVFQMPDDYPTCHRFHDDSLLKDIKFNI